MIEWVLRAWNILQDEITCIKYGLCTELLVHPRNLQNTDPFQGTQQDKVYLEDIPGIPTDPDDQHEDADNISLTNVNQLSKFVALIFQWKQCKGNTKDHLYTILILS